MSNNNVIVSALHARWPPWIVLALNRCSTQQEREMQCRCSILSVPLKLDPSNFKEVRLQPSCPKSRLLLSPNHPFSGEHLSQQYVRIPNRSKSEKKWEISRFKRFFLRKLLQLGNLGRISDAWHNQEATFGSSYVASSINRWEEEERNWVTGTQVKV